MYLPRRFEMRDRSTIHDAVDACGLANLITFTGDPAFVADARGISENAREAGVSPAV